jgi:adhesin transport system outer membrane protein
MLLRFTRHPLIWLGLLSGSCGLQAQSLTDVVQQALSNYPALVAAQARADAARADIARARSAHYPQISFGAGINSYASGSVPSSLGRTSLSPSARVNLWSGGRIEADAQRSEALTQASEAQQRLTQDDVALQASEAYLGWLKGQELLALAQHNLQGHQDTLSDIRTIAEVDTGRRIDLAQAQVRVDNARLTVQARQAELAIAVQRLRRYWPEELRSTPGHAGTLDLSQTPLASLPASLADAQAHVDEELPALAQLRAQVVAAQAAVRQAQGLYWPTVDLVSSRQFNSNTLRFETLTQLQMNMAVYNGFATDAQIDAAVAQLRAAEASLEEARLQQKEKITQAWEEWLSVRSRADLGNAQSEVSDRVVDGYRQQFRLARRSLLDLLNIQADSFNYRNAAKTAVHDERIARARLLAAMGELARRFAPAQPGAVR